MATYLRDQHVENLSFDSAALTQLNHVFQERYNTLVAQLLAEAPQVPAGQQQIPPAWMTYIIRFDNKGYRVFSIAELLQYFNQARNVERLIFTVESTDALSSNRARGAYLELCVDGNDPQRCLLVSSSDNKDWAEGSFVAVHEVLTKFKTKYCVARTNLTRFAIQLLFVILNFTASFAVAFQLAPNMKIESAFLLAVIFALVLFGNVWGYGSQLLFASIGRAFPNIEFLRPAKAHLHWVYQAIIGSTMFAIVVCIFGWSVSFMTSIFANVFKI